MASSTRVRFLVETVVTLLITRETVVMETFALRATSLILGLFFTLGICNAREVVRLSLSDGVADFDLGRLFFQVGGRDIRANLQDLEARDIINPPVNAQCVSH